MNRSEQIVAATAAKFFDKGVAAYQKGDRRKARRAFDKAALAAMTVAELAQLRVRAVANAAGIAHELGDTAEAIAGYRSALSICDGLDGDPLKALRPNFLIGLAPPLLQTGRYDEADAALGQARELLDRDDLPLLSEHDRVTQSLSASTSLTALAAHREDWVRANEYAQECLELTIAHRPEMVGAPLMNLADIALHTGRLELAVDFGQQALAAFEANGDADGAAAMRRGLAQMYLHSDRLDEAEALLHQSLAHFTATGVKHHVANGTDMLGVLASLRGDTATAERHFAVAAREYAHLGEPVAAAEVLVRRGITSWLGGRADLGEQQLFGARATFVAHGMRHRLAVHDFTVAGLLELRLATAETPDPRLLARAVDLAIPAAIALDAVGHRLVNGRQREHWRRKFTDPAMALALRLAAVSGDIGLVAQLIDNRCAGTPVQPQYRRDDPDPDPGLDLRSLMDLPPEPAEPTDDPPLQLGSALAEVAAGAGLRVDLPPRLAVAPSGGVVLSDQLARAEDRYGAPVRQNRTVPTW